MVLGLAAGVILAVHFHGTGVAAREPDGTVAAALVGCTADAPARGPAACLPERRARADDLTGTWLRTGVSGVWSGDEGREFLRFDGRGVFTWGLAGPYRDVHGRYSLSSGSLTVALTSTNLWCPAGTSLWWATLTRTGRLHLTPPTEGNTDGCGSTPSTWKMTSPGDGSRPLPLPSVLP